MPKAPPLPDEDLRISVGDILDGRYRIDRRIGSGGMGVVYQGEQLALKRKVAVKIMHTHLAENGDYAKRFEREVQINKELNHPNTVRTYDFGTTPTGTMYLVMEFLEGRELSKIFEKGPMTVQRAGKLGLQVLDGLGEAHAINVVHRDLKPGNIFLTFDRRGRELAKILDFGVAKALGDDLPQITRAGQIVGTARYIAPEVFSGADPGMTTDVYSMGVLLWEMICGRRLFEAESMREILELHLSMPVMMPKSLSEHPVAEVISGALAKDPSRRYPDAETMHAELAARDPARWEARVVEPEEVSRALEAMYEEAGHSYLEKKQTRRLVSTFKTATDEADDGIGETASTVEIKEQDPAADVTSEHAGSEVGMPASATIEVQDSMVMEATAWATVESGQPERDATALIARDAQRGGDTQEVSLPATETIAAGVERARIYGMAALILVVTAVVIAVVVMSQGGDDAPSADEPQPMVVAVVDEEAPDEEFGEIEIEEEWDFSLDLAEEAEDVEEEVAEEAEEAEVAEREEATREQIAQDNPVEETAVSSDEGAARQSAPTSPARTRQRVVAQPLPRPSVDEADESNENDDYGAFESILDEYFE